LRACGEEHDQILRKIDELQRLKRLHDALPTVREQHRTLTRRLEAMVSPVEEAEQALLDTADKVIVLRDEHLDDLDERTRQLLAKLKRSELEWATRKRRYAEEEEKLLEKRAEYEKLRTEQDGWLAALNQHAEIDRDLLDRLGAAREDTAMDRVHTM